MIVVSNLKSIAISRVASRLYTLSLGGLTKLCGTNTSNTEWRLGPRESHPRLRSDTMLERIETSNLKSIDNRQSNLHIIY